MESFILLFCKQLIVALLFISCFWGLGRITIRRLQISYHSILEDFFISTSLGIVISIIYVSILSMLGIMYKPLLLILLIGILELKNIKFNDRDQLKSLFLMFVLSLPILVLTLYPPSKWDDISYHLPIAQSILDHHRLVFNTYIRYPVFPINGEMLQLIGFSVNPITAQLMSWICLFVLSIGVFTELEKRYSIIGGILSFSLLLSNQLLILLGTISYIDIILSLFITSSVITLLMFIENNKNSWLIISALFLGTAVGIKYTALVFCLILGIILVIRRKWLPLINYVVIVMVIGLPWYIRNYFYTGNPVWPFMSSLFGYSDIWNVSDYEGQFADFKRNGLEKTFLNFLRIPWYLSQPTEGIENGINFFIWIGVLFALFYLMTKKKVREWILIIIAIVYTVFWFMSVNLARYYLPLLPILCIISARGYAYFINQIQDKKIRLTFYGCLILFGLFNSYSLVGAKIISDGLPPTDKSQVDTYLSSKLPTYRATKFASQLKGETFGLFNENLYFYGRGKVIGDWFGKGRYSEILGVIQDPGMLNQKLKELQVDYLLINKERYKGIKGDRIIKLENQFNKVYEDDYAIIYQVQ